MRGLLDIAYRLGDGSYAIGFITLPFSAIGLYLVIKGAVSMLDKIDKEYEVRSGFQASMIFCVMILSYMAFVIAIKRLL